jgi:hypothetical protein
MTEDRKSEDRLERLDAQARRLPVDIPPERDLWPGIAARIAEAPAPESGPRDWRMVGAIAAAVALVAVSSMVTLWVAGPREPAVVAVPSAPSGMTRQARTIPGGATFGPDVSLGPKYERARQQLSRDLDEQLSALPPESRDVVEKNLAQIRQALSEINSALAEDPGNLLLQQLLMAAYQDEMSMLMEMNRMAQSLTTRKEI